MANEENLVPFTSDQSREKAKENGKKGGIASGKAKRKRKAMKETLDTLLTMTIKNGEAADLEEVQSVAALNGKNITVQEALVLVQIQKALKGDTRAAMLVLEMMGSEGSGTVEQENSHNALIDAIRERNNDN